MEKPSSTKLCPVCKSLVWSDNSRETRNVSVSAFQTVRSTGCKSCRMILDAVEELEPGWAKAHAVDGDISLELDVREMKIRLRSVSIGEEPFLHGQFRMCLIHGKLPWGWVQCWSSTCSGKADSMEHTDLDDPVERRRETKMPLWFRNGIETNARTDETWRRVSSWFTDCVSNHLCRNRCTDVDASFMPSRVLDLKSLEDDRVILAETAKIKHPAPYTCLSYRWGSNIDGLVMTSSRAGSTLGPAAAP